MHVAALFRYPIKGFTREACDALELLPGGRVAGDRVFSLRLPSSGAPDDGWCTKMECVALVNTPGLARLRLELDHRSLELRVRLDDALLFEGVLDAAGRDRFAAAVADYLRGLGDEPMAPGADRLRLVGDGVTPRYQDREPGYVTLHGRASLADVAEAIGEPWGLAEQRFRSNIAIDGLSPWEEQQLIGRKLRVGQTELEIANPVTRCLATHAHPASGLRDIPVMKKLLELRPTARPTFAVLTTSALGGPIRIGDEVAVLD
jgi:uncharacterized protein YcbX